MSDAYLDDHSRPRIEALLGRNIADAEVDSVDSFAAFTDRDIAEFRRVRRELNTVYAIVFVMHKLKGRPQLTQVVEFCECALAQDQPRERWPSYAPRE